MMRYYQRCFFNEAKHILAPSYVVMQTSNFPTSIESFRISSLTPATGIRFTTFAYGNHLANSFTQLATQLLGTTIRNFPLISLYSLKNARRDIHSIVLPSPISSAKIPFNPCS